MLLGRMPAPLRVASMGVNMKKHLVNRDGAAKRERSAQNVMWASKGMSDFDSKLKSALPVAHMSYGSPSGRLAGEPAREPKVKAPTVC